MTTKPTPQPLGWIIDHPVWTMLISITVMLLVGYGGSKLAFKTDYRVFFSKDNPQLKAFQDAENRFTKSDNVLFMLAPKDGKVFTPATLQAVQETTRLAWKLPYVLRVDSISNFQHSYAQGKDDIVVEDLVDESLALTPARLQVLKNIALSEPLLVNRLISPRADVTGINVTIQFPENKAMDDVPKVTGHARSIAAQIERMYPHLDVYLTGMVMMDNAFSEAFQMDMQLLVPLSFLAMLVILSLLLRGWSGTFSTIWVIGFSIAGAMGMAGWLGIDLTTPSGSAPTIILTIAIANAVHILVSFYQALRSGLDKQSAMKESMRVNLQPVFLTSLTTALGFLSMNFSDAPPFRDLGNIVAMGVGFGFLLSVTLLPAFMMLLPVRAPKQGDGHGPVIEKFSRFVISNRNTLLPVMILIMGTLVALIPRNELNDQFVKYFDTSIPFRVHSDVVTDKLSGLYRLDYVLESGAKDAISEPAFLRQVERFQQWYNQQPEVVHVNSLVDVIKRLNKNMHGDNSSYYKLPDSRELTAQYILLYEMSLPKGLDLNDQINVDKSALRMSVTLKTLTTKALLALERRAQQWLQSEGINTGEGTGTTMMFSHIAERNIKGMLLGSSMALVLISLILVVAMRSIKIGLISLLPNLVPAAMGFGLWAVVVGEVGLGLSVVVGMTLGIVVDDTVHFLSKYLRARRELGKDAVEAVHYAFTTVGTALWVTSLVLIVGFSILALSSFKLNSGMGALTAITIAMALLADFLFLPPLLMKLDGKKQSQPLLTAAKPAAEQI